MLAISARTIVYGVRNGIRARSTMITVRTAAIVVANVLMFSFHSDKNLIPINPTINEAKRATLAQENKEI